MPSPTLPDDGNGDNGLGAWTPGPWRFGGYAIQAYTDGKPGIVLRETIAFMDRGDDPDRRDANARLIAAAPELFEALANLRAGIGAASLSRNPYGKQLRDAADAALARARGK